MYLDLYSMETGVMNMETRCKDPGHEDEKKMQHILVQHPLAPWNFIYASGFDCTGMDVRNFKTFQK